MRRYAFATAFVVVSICLCVGFSGPVRGQEKNNDAAFAVKLWDWMQKADYQNWAPLPGQDGDFYKGKHPHGALLKMYANRAAFSNLKDPPHGSIIIKENFNQEKKLMAVTIMYRVKNYDPKNHDWFWVKYDPNGAVAKKGQMPLAGKVAGCIKCHGAAAGNDFLFVNDQ